MRVVGHVANGIPLAHALAMHQASIEHLTSYLAAVQRDDSPFARPDLPRDLRAFTRRGDYLDPVKVAAVARATHDAGVWNCPTLLVNANELPSRRGGPRAAETAPFVSPLNRAEWDPSKSVWTASLDAEDWRAAERTFQARLAIVRALHDAGAGLLAGTDSASYDAPGFSLYDELSLMEEAGLRPFDALATATRDVGVFLHHSDIGRVVVDAVADLVLVEADPRLDVRNAERRVGVALRGHWYPEADLRARRQAVAASFAASKRWRDLTNVAGPAERAESTSNWRITAEGVEIGEARLALAPAPGNGTVLHARESVEEPFGAPDVAVDADGTATGETRHSADRIEEVTRTLDGSMRASMQGNLPCTGACRSWETSR